MPILDTVITQLDKLSAADCAPFPVLSLYLDLSPDSRGRDNFEPFLRKELGERLRTYAAHSPERASMEKDAERIGAHVAGIDGATNGLAAFACSGADLFEVVELAAPFPEHRLYVSEHPHLYPLARLVDEYPRYVVLLADTHSATIVVCAANTLERTAEIHGTKTRRHKMGGWSQARYQRHVENFHIKHAKEVVEALAKVVRDESIASIVLSADEVVLPLLKEYMPKDVAERIVDIVKLDARAPEREILDRTIAIVRDKDAETDRERVDALLGAYRATGLACVGVEDTARAFELGQVDELLITAVPATIDANEKVRVANDLVAKARQTSARTRFIEDSALLEAVGGVGAFLRFRL